MSNSFKISLILLLLIFVSSTKSYCKTDSLLMARVNLIENELSSLKQTNDSLLAVHYELRNHDTLFAGLFERYSTRTENMVSWILGILATIVAFAGFFSIKSIFDKIKTGNNEVRESYRQDNLILKDDLAKQIDEVTKLKKDVKGNLYILFSNLAVLSNMHELYDPAFIKSRQNENSLFSLIVFEQAYNMASDEQLESAKRNLDGGIFNAGNIVHMLEEKAAEYSSKEEFLLSNKSLFDRLKSVLTRLSKNKDEDISGRAIPLLGTLSLFEKPLPYPIIKRDANDTSNEAAN